MNKKLLLTFFTLVVSATVLLANLYFISGAKLSLSNNLIDDYGNKQVLLATQLAKTIELEVNNIKDKLYILAEEPEIKTPQTNTCNVQLEKYFELLKAKVNNIGRVGKDDLFVCSVNKGLIGTKASNLGTYIDEIFNDPNHTPVLSRIIKIPNTGDYAIAIHVPIFDENKQFNGTLGAAVYLNDISNKFLSEFKLGQNGYATLLDNNGDILYHPKTEFIAKNADSEFIQNAVNHNESVNKFFKLSTSGNTGFTQYNFINVEKIGAYVPVKLINGKVWGVNVTLPKEEAYAALEQTGINYQFNRLLIINVLITMISSLLMLGIFIKFIFMPLDKIKKAAHEIGNGHLDTKIGINANDEIGQVAKVIEEMTDKLKSYYKDLQNEVKNKTTELEELNKKLQGKVIEEQNRAKDIEESTEEARSTNKVLVDRELRMIELKKEIEQLKKDNEALKNPKN